MKSRDNLLTMVAGKLLMSAWWKTAARLFGMRNFFTSLFGNVCHRVEEKQTSPVADMEHHSVLAGGSAGEPRAIRDRVSSIFSSGFRSIIKPARLPSFRMTFILIHLNHILYSDTCCFRSFDGISWVYICIFVNFQNKNIMYFVALSLEPSACLIATFSFRLADFKHDPPTPIFATWSLVSYFCNDKADSSC